jgi:hypothetical protein
MGRDPQPQELTIAKGVRQGEDCQDRAGRTAALDQQDTLDVRFGVGRFFGLKDRPTALPRDELHDSVPRCPKSPKSHPPGSRDCPPRSITADDVLAWLRGERSERRIHLVAMRARATGPVPSRALATRRPVWQSSAWLRLPTGPIGPVEYLLGTAQETGSTRLCTGLATRTNRPAHIAATGCS